MSDFKSKIPSELQVLGNTIDVRIKSVKGAKGSFCTDTEVLTINPGYDNYAAKRVLIHELVHAGLYFSGQAHLYTDEKEEALCDLMESVFGPLIDFKFEATLEDKS